MIGDKIERDQRQNSRSHKALVERVHHVVALAQTDEEHTDDRGDDARTANGQRIGHHVHHSIARKEDGGENHCGDECHRIGFEQVSRHARTVADIITDVIGDGRRIARIIFRNTGFDLADEIAADVRTLGEDAAAETGEDRDERRAETERHESVDDFTRIGRIAHFVNQHTEINGDREKGETGDEHAGDRARAEGDGKTSREADARRLRGAHVGPHRHQHADVTGKTG